MITIDRVPKEFKVHTYNEFIKITTELDEYLGSTTYIVHAPIDTLWYGLLGRADPSIFLKYTIERLFSKSDIVYTNDPEYSSRDLEKLNTISVLATRVSSGERLIDPLSFNYFENSKWGIHPGNSRLFLCGFYTKPVCTIVTDFKGTVKKDYPKIDFINVQDIKLQLSEGRRIVLNIADKTNNLGPNSVKQFDGNRKIYKELLPPHDGEYEKLADPTLYNPPRVYSLKKNGTIVTVDDRVVFQKVNDRWQIYNP